MERNTQFRKALGNALFEQGSLLGFYHQEDKNLVTDIKGHVNAAEAERMSSARTVLTEAKKRLTEVEQQYRLELEKVLCDATASYGRLTNVYQHVDSSEFDEPFITALTDANLTPEEADMFIAHFLVDGPFDIYEDLELAVLVATTARPTPTMTDIMLSRAIDCGATHLAVKVASLRKTALTEQQIDALVFVRLLHVPDMRDALRAAKLGCSPTALNALALAMLFSPDECDVEECIAIADSTENSA